MLAHPPNPAPARDVNLASCQSTTPPGHMTCCEPLDRTDPGLLHGPPDRSGPQGQVVYGPRPRHVPMSPQVQRTGLQGFRSPQGRLCCTGALQVPSATAPEKATAHSRPFITDFDMSDMDIQLHRSNIILSYQDWFPSPAPRTSTRAGNVCS